MQPVNTLCGGLKLISARNMLLKHLFCSMEVLLSIKQHTALQWTWR